jgi:hypothetical protein
MTQAMNTITLSHATCENQPDGHNLGRLFRSPLLLMGQGALVGPVYGALCWAAFSGQAQSVPLVTNHFDSGLETFN